MKRTKRGFLFLFQFLELLACKTFEVDFRQFTSAFTSATFRIATLFAIRADRRVLHAVEVFVGDYSSLSHNRFTRNKMSSSSSVSASSSSSSSSSAASASASGESLAIDRYRTCPFLVRIFISTNGRHSPLDSYFGQQKVPTYPQAIEVPLHCWNDVTLREVAARVQAAFEPARRKGAKISLALVFPDKTGRYVMKNVGVVSTSASSAAMPSTSSSSGAGGAGGAGEKSSSSAAAAAAASVDSKTLGWDLKAQPGDYIDVAVIQPLVSS